MLPKFSNIKPSRFAISQTTALIRTKLPQSTSSSSGAAGAVLQPIRIHSTNHPTHPLAFLKQSRSQHHRWLSTNVRNLASKYSTYIAPRYDRSSLKASKVGKAIVLRGTAPFASTLRPNLTGGALPRSAGGYCLGGGGIGARHFSHTPAVQAQVVQNVSAGMRAFFIGGGKARFDGLDNKTGEKRFKAVSRIQDEVLRKVEKPFKPLEKGTNLEFHLSPTITAFSTSKDFHGQTLISPDLLSTLSIDFARALKDLSAVLVDLQHLSTLGDLPINLAHTPSGTVLTCRFPGCDAQIVSQLCDEVGIQRGIIREDEAWDQDKSVAMALLFPFAPGSMETSEIEDQEAGDYFEHTPNIPDQLDWHHLMSPHEPLISVDELLSNMETDSAINRDAPRYAFNHRSKSPSGYESLRDSDFAEHDPYVREELQTKGRSVGSEDYEGLEGIYRFLRECEHARH